MPEAIDNIRRLQVTAASQAAGIVIPKIPYVPPPGELIRRVPQFAEWYQAHHRAMEQWREETIAALRQQGSVAIEPSLTIVSP